MIPELSETVRVSRDKYPDTDLNTREEVLHLAGQCVRILEESLNYPEIPESCRMRQRPS